MERCRVADAIFGSTSSGFCINQSSGNITKLLEYKTHLLEICLSLLWNRMGKTLLEWGVALEAAVLDNEVWAVWMSSFQKSRQTRLKLGSCGFSPNVLFLWLLHKGILWFVGVFCRFGICLCASCGAVAEMHMWLSGVESFLVVYNSVSTALGMQYFWRDAVFTVCVQKESIKTMNQHPNIWLALNFDILFICFNGIIHVAMRMLFKATCLLLEMHVLLCFCNGVS